MEMTSYKWQSVTEIELIYKSKVKASERPVIRASQDAADLLKRGWDENKIDFVEQFKILLLNCAKKVLGLVEISTGGHTCTVVDKKVIFAAALKANATGILLAHNHPSGNLKPSQADEAITRQIKMAGQLLDIQVLDHIIISSEGYYSFADEGLL
jgi:DNA repair protein RadC